MDEDVRLVRQEGRPLEEGRLTDWVTDIDRSERPRKCKFKFNVALDGSPLSTPET